jgi:DNA-binding transcriptional MerR regulator
MELSQITFDFNDAPEEEAAKKPAKKNNIEKNNGPKPKQARGRKSLKDNGIEANVVEIPEDEELFKKLYYAIGDVAIMFKENASLIRYWENEFDILKPKKNKKGDRFFRPEDIKNLKIIHHLLRERKYTIEGAKEFLKSNKSAAQKYEMIQSLQKLKSFLLELKASL